MNLNGPIDRIVYIDSVLTVWTRFPLTLFTRNIQYPQIPLSLTEDTSKHHQPRVFFAYGKLQSPNGRSSNFRGAFATPPSKESLVNIDFPLIGLINITGVQLIKTQMTAYATTKHWQKSGTPFKNTRHIKTY